MKSKITLLTLAATMVLTSCTKEMETTDSHGNVAATFTTQIQTRAVGNSWSANDQIGIFMIKAGENLAPPYIVNDADNVAYKTASAGVSGVFSPVDPAQTIYFPQSGNVDFMSYYPHKPSLTKFVYPIDVSDQSNQEAIDLLYSNNAVAKNSMAPSVAFNFKHKLSKLAIKPSSSGQYTKAEMDAMIVKIKGLNTVAEFSLAANTISKQSTPADITAKTVTAGASYEAIVLPVATLTGASIEFTIAGKTLTWEIKTSAFAEGNRYNYDLVLGSSSVTVGGSTIDDWEDNTDPSETPIKTISSTIVDNMEIKYNSTLADGRINEIRFREVDRTTGAYISGGFSDQINITYTPSTVTMQGTIPNPGAIDIYGKGLDPETINTVYTLNAAGLASSSTRETTIENKTKTYTTTYLYNADNQLVSVVEKNSSGEKTSECTAVWAAGNLMSTVIGSLLDSNQGGEIPAPDPGVRSASSNWESYTETYTYHATINSGGALYPRTLPSIYYERDVVEVFASVVGILGKGTKNLVAKLTDSDDYSTVFSYTFYEASLYPQYVTLSDPTDPQRTEKMTFVFK